MNGVWQPHSQKNGNHNQENNNNEVTENLGSTKCAILTGLQMVNVSIIVSLCVKREISLCMWFWGEGFVPGHACPGRRVLVACCKREVVVASGAPWATEPQSTMAGIVNQGGDAWCTPPGADLTQSPGSEESEGFTYMGGCGVSGRQGTWLPLGTVTIAC